MLRGKHLRLLVRKCPSPQGKSRGTCPQAGPLGLFLSPISLQKQRNGHPKSNRFSKSSFHVSQTKTYFHLSDKPQFERPNKKRLTFRKAFFI